MSIERSRRRVGSRSGIAIAGVAVCGMLIGTVGCVSTQVDDLDGFEPIPMSRVVPYPTQDELGERGFEVVIVQGNSGDLDAGVLEEPWNWTRQKLTEMAEAAGATALLTSPGSVDPLHPRALRAAAGSLLPAVSLAGDFEVPVVDEPLTPENIVTGFNNFQGDEFEGLCVHGSSTFSSADALTGLVM